MRQAINKMLGRMTAATKGAGEGRVPKTATDDGRALHASIKDNSDNGIRRQLVQVMLRDCLRRHGIPARWIGCQMMIAESPGRGPGLYIRLVLRHWDERLLRYAFAFETELLDAITQFEPQASTWLHGISWELDLRSSCPYPEMPESASWALPRPPVPDAQENSLKAVNAEVESEDEILQDLRDLERMFAAREMTPDSSNHSVIADFQKTRPP